MVKASEKYNKVLTGAITGLLVPVIAMLLFYLWKAGSMTIGEFYGQLIKVGALTNALSVSVFLNVFFFLLFNRFDMLRASKGILGLTIFWAIVVFILKLT
jgi:hypothetical protein